MLQSISLGNFTKFCPNLIVEVGFSHKECTLYKNIKQKTEKTFIQKRVFMCMLYLHGVMGPCTHQTAGSWQQWRELSNFAVKRV